MGTSSPRTVAPPDPRIAIEAQGRENRVGQRTPFGSATYGRDANGGWVVNTELSPGMEDLMNRQYGLGMTNSVEQQIDPRMMQIAGQLAQRYQQRTARGGGAGAGAMYLGGGPGRQVQLPDRPPGG